MKTKIVRSQKFSPPVVPPVPAKAGPEDTVAPTEAPAPVEEPPDDQFSASQESSLFVPPQDDHATEGIVWSDYGFPPGSPEPVVGWLVVVRGSGRGRFLPLGYGIHALGRGEGQRVRLNFGDRTISRHAHINVTYDGENRCFYVSPGEASKYAYLNGQPVLQMFPLKSGDRIRLGDTELAFVPFCGPDFDWMH